VSVSNGYSTNPKLQVPLSSPIIPLACKPILSEKGTCLNPNWIPVEFTEDQWLGNSFTKPDTKLALAIIEDWKKEIAPTYREYDKITHIWYFDPRIIELVRKIMRKHDTNPNQGVLF
jgi:hypothetical protein